MANCPPSQITKKAKSNTPDGSLATEVKQLIDDINNNEICEVIQLKVDQAEDKVKAQIEEVTAEAKEIASKFMPIMKVPGLKKLPKWAKKLVTGMITPQIKAYAEMIQQAIEMVSLLQELIAAVQNAQTKLTNCITEEILDIQEKIAGVDDALIADFQSEVYGLIADIQGEIDSAICDLNLNDTGLEVFDELLGGALTEKLGDFTSKLDSKISEGLSTLTDLGSKASSATGVAYNVNTSSKEAFMASVENGDQAAFETNMQTFLDLVPAENATPPTVSGTAQVGETITVDEGTWTGDGTITFSYQWYRGAELIPGATSKTYVCTDSDVGSTLSCEVDGENDAGGEEPFSDSTAAVIENNPVITSPLSIVGIPAVGSGPVNISGLVLGPGETATYQWKWWHIDANIRNNANTDTYMPVTSDINQYLACEVTVTSATGSVTELVGPGPAVPDPNDPGWVAP